tara:strand:+ start:635 stop:1798 length:1164 start_codon:yes stop_codon:yes gene_type:complete
VENKAKEKKIKKILFISPRNPFASRFSGDVIRAKKFIEFFEKKYQITIITIDNLKSVRKIGKTKIFTFKEKNIFLKLKYIFKSFTKFQPMQLGYFYSKEINDYVKNNYKNFDIVFCQSVRSAQFVKSLKIKKKILDMGDLYSSNYYQTFKNTSAINPMRYIYLFESILMKKYELICFKNFHKILLFSKKDIQSTKNFKKKIIKIHFGIDKVFEKFKFNKNNNKIIFIGNIKYLPNRLACGNFIKKIFPKILKINPDIKFHIIGEISKLNEFFWKKNRSIKIHGKVDNLKPLVARSFCGLANLNISPGPNTKILTYMSYGIPCVASKIVLKNFHAIDPKILPIYSNENELIKLIFKLKDNKKYSEYISKKSLVFIQKYKWEKVLKNII